MKDKYVTSQGEAQAVDEVRSQYYEMYWQRIAGWIGAPNSSLVDVPCGTGGMVAKLRSGGYNGFVYLVDLNPQMVAAAQAAVPTNAAYIIGDAAEIGEFIPEPVDAIICLNGFHIYIERKSDFLEGCRQILRPGGRLVIDVSSMALEPSSREYTLLHERLMRETAARLGSDCDLPPIADDAVLRRYMELFQQHGLTVVDTFLDEAVIPIARFNKATVSIPGRLRPRFPQLTDEQRRDLFLSTSEQAQAQTGRTTVMHSRLFTILTPAS